MVEVVDRRLCMYGDMDAWEISVTFALFFCEYKTAQKANLTENLNPQNIIVFLK